LGAALAGFTASAQAATIIGWEVNGVNSYGVNGYTASVLADYVSNAAGLVRSGEFDTSGSPASNAWGARGFSSGVVSFTLNVTDGYELSLAGFDNFWTRRSGTGPATGRLYYQVGNGEKTLLSSLNFTGTNSTGASALTSAMEDLSTIEALQHITDSVTFSIENLNAGGATGTWYISNHSGYDLSLLGELKLLAPVDVPEPSTWALLGAGAGLLFITWLRRRRGES
jgi:hypothetical protein